MGRKVSRTPSYELKIELEDVAPPVWRRVVVPGHWHLGLVHEVVQGSMGWTDSHLHEFEVGETRYGRPRTTWGGDVLRESSARLHEVLPDVGARMLYTYDFGDGWRHDIVVEAVGGPVQEASCVGGARACPPEDSGGPWGYAEMLAVVSDPQHPDHEQFVDWLGEDFDPEAFDVAAHDRSVRRIS